MEEKVKENRLEQKLFTLAKIKKDAFIGGELWLWPPFDIGLAN